jgi:hypothetical protein
MGKRFIFPRLLGSVSMVGLLVVVGGLLFAWRSTLQTEQRVCNTSITLAPQAALQQSFRSRYPQLHDLTLTLGTPTSQALSGDIEVLVQGAQMPPLLLHIPLTKIQHGQQLIIDLANQAVPLDTLVTFSIKNLTFQPLDLAAHTENLYPDGTSLPSGDLCFKIRYPFDATVLSQNLARYKPGIWGNGVWYWLWLCLAGLAVIYCATQLWQAATHAPDTFERF